MKNFLIYTNYCKDPQGEMTEQIVSYLEKKGHKGTKITSPDSNSIIMDEIPKDACYMLVLGGDGTMLRAAREVKDSNIPLIGVNRGTLGYMTEIEPANLEEALDKLMAGKFQVESRMMLKGCVNCNGIGISEEVALNDIVISRSGSLQMNRIRIYVNGKYLRDYEADGIIVTTPTGSTGYNLSAGGPIVEPKAQLIMLTPICPHTLNSRSIILSSENVIEIEIMDGGDHKELQMEVSFDGTNGIPVKTGDRIKIEKSEKITHIIHVNEVSFLEVLNKKMSDK